MPGLTKHNSRASTDTAYNGSRQNSLTEDGEHLRDYASSNDSQFYEASPVSSETTPMKSSGTHHSSRTGHGQQVIFDVSQHHVHMSCDSPVGTAKRLPDTYIDFAIVVSLVVPFCGLPALWLGLRVKRHLARGELREAWWASDRALALCLAGMWVVGLVMIACYIVVVSGAVDGKEIWSSKDAATEANAGEPLVRKVGRFVDKEALKDPNDVEAFDTIGMRPNQL